MGSGEGGPGSRRDITWVLGAPACPVSSVSTRNSLARDPDFLHPFKLLLLSACLDISALSCQLPLIRLLFQAAFSFNYKDKKIQEMKILFAMRENHVMPFCVFCVVTMLGVRSQSLSLLLFASCCPVSRRQSAYYKRS